MLSDKAMLELCRLYYNEETFEHAKRVAEYAKNIYRLYPYITDGENFIYHLALAHDLYEDTDISQNTWFDNSFEHNLQLLTKKEDESYNDYIAEIRREATIPSYKPAYIVKLADMKDHLSQTETLTEELKNKYISAMKYLL
jgi:hypothetical protein